MLEPWYLTGFSEGEAAFTYSKAGKGLNLYFAIKSNADERSLIERIRSFFGVGKYMRLSRDCQEPTVGLQGQQFIIE